MKKKRLISIIKGNKRSILFCTTVIFLIIAGYLLYVYFQNPQEKLVLVVNTDKSVYRPGESVKVQMASLDKNGHTLCNSNLKVEIKSPGWKWWDRTPVPVTNSFSCGDDNVTNEPDYVASFSSAQTGKYRIILTNLDNRQKESSEFYITKNPPVLEIKRAGATRINPFKSDRYPMVLTVTAGSDYRGTLEETVPKAFDIVWQGTARLEKTADTQKLSWYIDLRKGQTMTLSYEYKAPGVSPESYVLGPVEAERVKIPTLFWHIASDATKTASVTGNWSSTATWGGSPVPGASDDVVINTGVTVTFDDTGSSISVLSITINGTGELTFPGNSIPSPYTNALTVTGNVTNNGTIRVINQSGAAYIHNFYVGGNWTNNGTFTPVGNDDHINVILNGTGAQQIGGSTATTFNNLTVSNTSNTVSATNNFSINLTTVSPIVGTMTVDSGAVFYSGTYVVSGAGAFTLSSGGTLGIGSTAGITSSGASGNIQVTGTRTYSTGANYIYNGSANQATGNGLPATVNNLTVNNSGGGGASTVTLGASITVGNNLAVSAGILADGGYQIVGNGSGTFTMSAGTTLLLGSGTTATAFPTNFTGGNITLNTASTVTYQANATTTVSATPAYGNLSFLPTLATSGKTYTFSGAATINGDFTVNPTAASSLALTVTLGGNTTIASTKTTTVTGTTSGTSNLGTGSNYSFSTGLLVIGTAGTFTANNSAVSITASSGTIFSQSGTFSYGGSTVTVSGSGTLSFLAATTFNNLTVTGTETVSTDFTVNGILTVSGSGNLSPTAGTITKAGGSISNSATLVFYGLTLSSAVTTSSSFSVIGTWTNSGTFTQSSGTVTFNASGSQSITGGTNTFYGLTVSSAGTRTVTIDSTTTLAVADNGTLTLSGGSQYLTLQSNDSSDWDLHVSSTGTSVTVHNVSVSHSNAGGYKEIDATDGSNYNGGNNTNWAFPAAPTATPTVTPTPIPVSVVYWPFDEGYGPSVTDSSGGISGDITGASWQQEELCKNGMCLYFDGSSWIGFGNEANMNFPADTGFTIEFWYRQGAATSTETIFQKYDSGSGDGGFTVRMLSDGDIFFGIDDANGDFADDQTESTAAVYDDNRWHHIAAVKDGTVGIYLYIDGKLVDSDTSIASVGTLENDDNLYIGDAEGSDDGNEFAGFLDEVKIYTDAARTAAEIKSDMLGQTPSRGAAASFGPDQSYLSDGLVGYWKMDEATNSVRADSSGNGNNLNESTGDDIDGLTGKFAGSGDFENSSGEDEYLSISDASQTGLDITNSITVCSWFNPETTSDGFILSKYNTGTNQRAYALRLYDGDLWFHLSSDGTLGTTTDAYSTGNAISAGNWYHGCGIYDGQTMTVFINGEIVATSNHSGGIKNSSANFNLGSNSNPGSFYDGKIDDVRVYNRALTSAEVRHLANWAPGPVGWWKMDEGSGNNVYDSSGNGYNGTLSGNPLRVIGKYGGGLHTTNNNGTAEYADITDQDVLDFSNVQDFTYSAWIRSGPSENNYWGWIRKIGNSPIRGYYLEAYSSTEPQCNYRYDTDEDIAVAAAISDLETTWHYVTCLMDRNGFITGNPGLYIFVDGVLSGSNTVLVAADASDNPGNLQIGESTNTSFENDGTTDDVRIYNYARTPGQIVEDMNAGHPAPGSPIGSAIGHWSFDEGYGPTVNDFGTGGNNGTLVYNAAWSDNGKFGKAIYLDGSDNGSLLGSSVELPDDAFTTQSEGTVAFWFKPNDSGDTSQEMFAISDGSWYMSSYQFKYSTTNNRVEIAAYGCSSNIIAYTPTLTGSSTDWHHFSYAVDSSGNKVYIDGKETPLTYTEGDASVDCWIDDMDKGVTLEYSMGCFKTGDSECDTDQMYEGYLDEVYMFGSALSADQIKLLYNQGSAVVMGALSTDPSGEATYSATRSYCLPGNTEGHCAAGFNPAPVAHWKFDENTGINVYDTTGNNHNSTSFTGDTKWVSGKYGSSLSFDGTGDHVEFADHNDFSADTTNQLTVEAWVKFTSTSGTQLVVSKDAWSSNYEWYMGLSGGEFAAVLQQSDGSSFLSVISATPAVVANTWYHMAFTADISSPYLYLYVDGIKIGEDTSTSGSYSNGTADLWIGDNLDGNGVNGIIDEVRIYNYARTSAQIAWDMNRGAPVAWWEMDECSGTAIHDTMGRVSDGTIYPGASGNTSAGTCDSGTSTEMWNDGTNGKFNGSLGFDGSDDYALVSDDADMRGSNSVTVAAWIYANSLDDYDVIAAYGDNGSSNLRWNLNTSTDDKLMFDASDNGTDVGADSSNTSLPTGEWVHVAATFGNTNQLKLYINGRLDKTATIGVSSLNESPGDLYIGRRQGYSSSRLFDGLIDDLRIYNYTLTPEQVKLVMNDGSAVRMGPEEGSPE